MKKRHGLILLLLAAASPAWAQDPAADYRDGVAARLAGDAEQAARALERVVAAQPANSDAWIQLGLALLALDRLDAAEAAFERTLALAPDYQDARVGMARIAQRRGDRAAALAALDRIAAPGEEARAFRAQLERDEVGPAPGWSIDLDIGYAWVEDGQPDWKEGAFRVRRAADGLAFTGTLEASRRFERTDVYGELRMDGRLSPVVDYHLLAGATPGADFRPRCQIGGGLAWRVTAGSSPTVLRLDARHADYRAGAITTLNPSIEQYLADGRVWLTGQWINLFDAQSDQHRMGWLGRLDVMANERLRLFGGLADAPDLSEGVAVDVFSLFGGFVWQASDDIALRLSVARDDRASGPDRTSLTIGLGTAF